MVFFLVALQFDFLSRVAIFFADNRYLRKVTLETVIKTEVCNDFRKVFANCQVHFEISMGNSFRLNEC